jgi:hypothetical protein
MVNRLAKCHRPMMLCERLRMIYVLTSIKLAYEASLFGRGIGYLPLRICQQEFKHAKRVRLFAK